MSDVLPAALCDVFPAVFIRYVPYSLSLVSPRPLSGSLSCSPPNQKKGASWWFSRKPHYHDSSPCFYPAQYTPATPFTSNGLLYRLPLRLLPPPSHYHTPTPLPPQTSTTHHFISYVLLYLIPPATFFNHKLFQHPINYHHHFNLNLPLLFSLLSFFLLSLHLLIK